MLYDNAQLAQVYTRAWLVTREDATGGWRRDTLEYLIREMRHPDGGFFSSQDADSEGVEGKFFAWSWDELVMLIGEDAAEAFGATQAGNWEGTNVLWLRDGGEPAGSDLADARRVLFEAREDRVRPATDDKVLTAWNAMAIQAFAEAGRAFERPDFLHAATACAKFIGRHLRDPAGRLLRSWRDGIAGAVGVLRRSRTPCVGLSHAVRNDGRSPVVPRGGAPGEATSSSSSPTERTAGSSSRGSTTISLVIRPKELYDNAVPSGNSAAAEVLQRMSLFTGDPEEERLGVSAIRLVRDVLGRAPTGFGHALSALDLLPRPDPRGRHRRRSRGPTDRGTRGRSGAGRASSRTPSSRSPTPETVRRSKRSRSSATVHRSTACPPRTCVSASRVACPSPARKILAVQLAGLQDPSS